MHSFYHLLFFNKRDIDHLLCMLLVFVLSLTAESGDSDRTLTLKLVAIVRKVDIVMSHDCDMAYYSIMLNQPYTL